MNRTLASLLSAVLLAAVALGGCGSNKAASPPATSNPADTQGQLPPGVVATYSNKKITKQQFETRIHIFEFIYDQPLSENVQAKANILDDMVTRNLLYEEAMAKGFKADEKKVNDELDDIHKDLNERVYQDKATSDKKMTELGITEQDLRDLVNLVATTRLMIEDLGVKNKPTDEEVKAYFDEHQAEFGEEVRASHILVADEAKAKELLAKIKSGGDFAQLAKENSTDTGTAVAGGDLEFFGRGSMVDEFDKAAFALNVGEVSEPVQTKFGWHIIKLTDKKPARTFEQAKEEVTKNLQEQKAMEAAQKLVTDLKEKANIKMATFAS